MAKSYYNPAPLPDFFTDPMYTKSEADMYGYGTGIMSGNLPDFYKVLGTSNSPEFQDMLRRSNANIEKSTLEAGARTGTRGGAVASAISKAVGENTGNLQWADYMNMINQKSGLLTTGLNTVGGARDSAYNFMNLKNNFNLDQTRIDETQRQMQAKLAAEADARKSSSWSSILSSALGMAGTIGGFAMGGPIGAGIAGQLFGSATGGGGGSTNLGNPFEYSNSMDFTKLLTGKGAYSAFGM